MQKVISLGPVGSLNLGLTGGVASASVDLSDSVAKGVAWLDSKLPASMQAVGPIVSGLLVAAVKAL